ncbi:MAG: hypothetical protein OXH53_13460 [bacterium]|nr:hypothetical protein [bacterium]
MAIALTPSLNADDATMTLQGNLSFDPDDGNTGEACAGCTYKWEVVTSTWKFLEGFADTTNSLTTVTPTIAVANVDFASLVPSNGALIEFRLTVTDAKGASDSTNVTYNIMTNDTPTADISLSAMLADPDAAADATTAEKYSIDAVIDGPGENGNADNEWDIREGALLVLDGSGSSDPDDDDLNYLWTLVYETGSTTGVNYPTSDDGTSHGTGATSTLVATGATTDKISTDGSTADTPDPNKTVGRLNVALGQTDISQSPYNVIYTLAVTDAGAAVTADNTDSTALIRIVIHDESADPTVTAKIEDTIRTTSNVIDGGAVAGGSANVIAPPGSGRYQVIPDSDDATDLTVTLTATAYDADGDIDDDGTHVVRDAASGLLTGNDGTEVAPGVTWSSDDLPDSAIATADDSTASNAKTATVTIPATAEAGDTFTITATVNRSEVSTSITLVIAESNQRPVATILTPLDTGTAIADVPGVGATTGGALTGAFGIANPLDVTANNGVYTVNGFGFDSDGSVGVVNWTQLDPSNSFMAMDADSDDYVPLTGAFSNSVSFSTPENDELQWVLLAFTVIDDTGAFHTVAGVVPIAAAPDAAPAASAGAPQIVQPESTVVLAGSSSGFEATPAVTYTWTIESVTTTPGPETLNSRASMKVHEDLNSFIEAANNENYTNTGEVDAAANTAGTAAVDAEDVLTSIPASVDTTDDATASGQFQHFTAPKLSAGLRYVQITFKVTATGTIGTDTDQTRSAEVIITVATDFFSSYIDGPDYCYNKSLGGAQTYPHDSNADGVADVCSLASTRREAVARQNALETLVALGSTLPRTVSDNGTATDTSDDVVHQATLEDLVLGRAANDGEDGTAGNADDETAIVGTCARAKGLAKAQGFEPNDPDACDDDATELTPPPSAIDPADAAMFYSGVITGPDFCADFSLGGARQYADDIDDDGVADQCSLHTTRREAVARQLALEMFTAHPQFNNALAAACTALGSETYGAKAEDLAKDACSIPPGTPEAQPGNALP